MKTHVLFRAAALAALLPGLGTTSQAQLAITEVMAQATVHLNPDVRRPDYWELTNFGDKDIDMQGYMFSDSRRTEKTYTALFDGLIIHPGESVIFFRYQIGNVITTPEEFRAWWGDANLPTGLEIRTYNDPGLNGEFPDEVWVYDPQTNVVDWVRFGESRVGRSFGYEPDTGIFGLINAPGVYGAFQAAESEDVGSPGTTLGPASLRVLQHPLSQIVDAGADATFTVVAAGLPRPRYQWLTNGVALPGATDATLVLSNVQPEQAGQYSVRLENGLEMALSSTATLTVNTNPAAPRIIRAPADVVLFPRQTAVLSVLARGFPAPQYQWELGGELIAGATSPVLEVTNVTMEMSGFRYTVRIWNELGATNASASIRVVRRPDLRFTEVMPAAVKSDSSGHYDWFELTSYETNTVDLQGYRFFDTPTFVGAFTIRDPLVIEPGESIVFVEEMTPAQFANWWGAENLPPGFKLCTYQGFSLRDVGENLYLWNGAARDAYEYVSTAGWAGCTVGISLECVSTCLLDEDYGCIADCLTDSVPGVNGAFHRLASDDVGSPGYTANPAPRVLRIEQQDSGVRLQCRGIEGRVYRLVYSATLTAPQWNVLGTQTTTNALFSFEDQSVGSSVSRFYRLEAAP